MTVQIYRGDTWQRRWVIKDASGTPINLTGAAARLHVRDAKQALIYPASTETGELVITGIDGAIDLRIDAVDTKTWATGKYKYDLEVTNSAGIVKTYESEVLNVLMDQTHD